MSGAVASRRPVARTVMVLGVLGVTGVAAAFVLLTVGHASGITRGAVVGAVLISVTLPALHWLLRDESTTIRRIVMGALLLHLVAGVVYLVMVTEVFTAVDANWYDTVGTRMVEQSRYLDFPMPYTFGTRFIAIVTGGLYTVMGSSLLGGGLVFSWLSFWGLYLFWRAFTLAVPDGRAVRYAVLVLLLPSLVFWPATIGKDSWMVLMLGISAYGLARFLTQRSGGLPLLLAGLVGATLVRAHVAALALAAAGAAAMVVPVGSRHRDTGRRGLVARVVLLGFVVAAVGFVAGEVAARFGINDALSPQGVEQVLQRTERQTQRGGSSFETGPVASLAAIPESVVTVIFRPFPWESDTPQALVASLEGVILVALMWRWRAGLVRLIPRMRQRPYLAFAAAFTLGFVFAFGSVANFGILARQRTQMLPFLLVLLAAGIGEPEVEDARIT